MSSSRWVPPSPAGGHPPGPPWSTQPGPARPDMITPDYVDPRIRLCHPAARAHHSLPAADRRAHGARGRGGELLVPDRLSGVRTLVTRGPATSAVPRVITGRGTPHDAHRSTRPVHDQG